MQNLYKDTGNILKIAYIFEHRQKYDIVISKSKYIKKALEHNFRKLFSLVHRGCAKKKKKKTTMVDWCLVRIQILKIVLWVYNMSWLSIHKCYSLPLENTFSV